MNVLVVYYSMDGHVHKMAEAVAEGAGSAGGVDAELRRVPETLSRFQGKRVAAIAKKPAAS